MKNFPARLKSYASFEYVQRMIRNYLKVNQTVASLKSEALKVSGCGLCDHPSRDFLLGTTLEAVDEEVGRVLDPV